MGVLKIANLNAEWMVNFFKPGSDEIWIGPSKTPGLGSKPKDVRLTCQRLAGVIKDVDAEIVGIEEGPPKKSQMEAYVKTFLNDAYKVFSMPDGRQSNHALVRKGIQGVKIEQMPATHSLYKHISNKITYYTWGELKKARIEKFTRKPVVLRISKNAKSVEVFVFHTKSKISKLKNKKEFTARDREAMIDALRSRQKLSAEMAAVRRYLSHAILSKRTDGVILIGDLNDGPHRDIFEEQFLIHSIVDELRGGFDREAALMHHAMKQEFLEGEKAFTADFNDPTQGGKRVKVMLDHIMVTTSIKAGNAPIRLITNSGIIEHDAHERHIKNTGRKRDERPSDHRPVSARFRF
jgi:hypothetical protein